MVDRSLQGVVIAFDLDNTLLDRGADAYRQTVDQYLSEVDPALDPQTAFEAYEKVRSLGHALERVDLLNPIHHRGHPETLGLLFLTGFEGSSLRENLNINEGERGAYRAFLERLKSKETPTRSGSPEDRLASEISLREFLRSEKMAQRLPEEVRRLAADPVLAERSKSYRRIESQQPQEAATELLEQLGERGGHIVVISEGRSEIQREKLARLGLTDRLAGRALISEDAAAVPEIETFRRRLNEMIDAAVAGRIPADDPQLLRLWRFHCVIDSWAWKTPWYYGRCLHALHDDPCNPEAALKRLAFSPQAAWRENPLRFVMIGDRYDRDVLPLLQLLGAGTGMRIRLATGKYRHLSPSRELPPDLRPDKSFTDWADLSQFLSESFSAEDIGPIADAPDVMDRALISSELVKWGTGCEFEAVRQVSALMEEMLRR